MKLRGTKVITGGRCYSRAWGEKPFPLVVLREVKRVEEGGVRGSCTSARRRGDCGGQIHVDSQRGRVLLGLGAS